MPERDSRIAHRQRFFISYSHRDPTDFELANRLAHELEATGHQVFVDSKMPVGSDWVEEVARRIEWCEVFVVLLSETSSRSEMVQAEIRLAHQRRQREQTLRIVPVRVNYLGPLDYELDAYLSRTHYASWRTSEDTKTLLNVLLAATESVPNAPDSASVVAAADRSSPGIETDPRRPQPKFDPRALSAPGGTLRLDDPFYLERVADAVVTERAGLRGETVVIKAPRQMGKSSLLMRYLAACRKAGKRIVFLDFSTFSDIELQEYPTLLTQIARLLGRSFGVETLPPERLERQGQLTRYIENQLLTAVSEPVAVAFDEVDRVFGQRYQADFFTLLRMWHNQRADFASPWDRVDLALVISTEPYLLIDAADRSPFNVTPPVGLAGFDLGQCSELNRRYGLPLTAAEVVELHGFLAGHPYLTRLAFYRLVSADQLRYDDLTVDVEHGHGPFGDHLRALLMKLTSEPEMANAMRQVLAGRRPERDASYRLRASGLVRGEHGSIVAANCLYERFFRKAL